MKNRRIILSIVLIVFYKYSYSQDFYDIKINYLKSRIVQTSSKLKSEEEELSRYVHLFFETGFKNDDILLVVNDTSEISLNVTTDESLGLAKYIKLGKIDEVKNFSVRIGNGALAYIELIKNQNCIGVYMVDNILTVDFIEGFPSYY